MTYENMSTEELVKDVIRVDAEIKQRDMAIKDIKELNALLPQVFTRDGKVRKDTRRNMRGLDNVIASLKMAERARTDMLGADSKVLVIDLPCGTMHLSEALADYIWLNDLFAALATKGWQLTVIE